MSTRTTAWFVGEGSLLVQCAEAFLEAGHTVQGVASSDAAVRRWSEGCGLETVALADMLGRLFDRPFDYLFSIVNLELLPDAVIAAPRILAANFHDGPLPRYAGLNTPVWALLNKEARYGVTWHEMTTTVDAGRILKQELFEIPDGETAFSLNARCYEAGLQSFTGLVEDISHDRVSFTPQDFSLRTEFRRYDRPAGGGVVSWDEPADDIKRLVLALDFGPYPNPFGAARLLTPRGAFLINAIDDVEVEASSPARPGTVVEIQSDAVVVATATSYLAIRGVRRVTGEPLTIPQFVSQAGIKQADELAAAAGEWRRHIEDFQAAATRNEAFWVRRLAGFEPVAVPYVKDRHGANEAATTRMRIEMEIPGATVASICVPATDPATALPACVALYLARLSGGSRCGLAFTESRFAEVRSPGRSLFADAFPVEIDLGAASFANAAASLARQRQDAAVRGPFFLDVLARYPALSRLRAFDRWSGPVIVASVGDLSEYTAPPDVALAIVTSPHSSTVAWDFAPEMVSPDDVRRMQRQLLSVIDALAADPARVLRSLPLLGDGERARVLVDWNRTARPRDPRCVHEQIEDQAARTPDATAIVCQGHSITYLELNARANQMARRLQLAGVGPEVPVGVCLDRSIELMVSLLGVLKAGGAYVPLDPHYPHERLAFVATDARLTTVITEDRLATAFPMCQHTICPHLDHHVLARQDSSRLEPAAADTDLAYVMYTSGSTGTPKGVMVEHRNVTNFCAAMDERVPSPAPGVWLAVTSVSFDISVLELFWTLARGFKVVIYTDDAGVRQRAPATPSSARRLDFSLFYFSADENAQAQEKYRLLLEGARFADTHDFTAVWTPERHFHAFGGLYPNPSVTSAALAVITSNIRIRAGSCVNPLHHPLRVAEEWSVVDNLSGGRVGLSFASGWQPNDFILRPENYADRKAVMLRDIETIRALWRGEPLECASPGGKSQLVRTLPRPVQAELPVWLTAAGNPETFQAAASIGAGVLTHLVGQSLDELSVKIAGYRAAWQAAGHPGHGHIVLMLHTLVSDSDEYVRETVREPMGNYLRTSIELIKPFAESFPTFKARPGESLSASFAALSKADYDALVQHSFERYYETSGLFGTPERCGALIERLKAAGIDEAACLIDFGVPADVVLANLPHLDRLRQQANRPAEDSDEYSIPALIARHGVTHLQCTPSMARMLLLDAGTRESLRALKALLVGGEALPPALAAELGRAVPGDVWNMYGPTETTVWSTAWQVDPHSSTIPIGRPVANTQTYVLDAELEPVPVGLPGNLFIGGDGVARGYWGRPDLSSERFRPNPFVTIDGQRMYFTGDIARYREDGSLEFLGRSDHQVKIRGHRIELGEIEATLAAHPAVRDVVVAAREDVPDDKRLTAYVVVRAEPAATTNALRDYVSARLPDYMVPSYIVRLDAMPLTPNGKIDRRALPSPERIEPSREVVVPVTDLQREVAGIWQEVLRSTQVGTEDNFFDLGGNSLLAAQVLSLLRSRVSEAVSLTDLFRYPTIRALTDHLGGASAPSSRVSQSIDRARLRQEAAKQRRSTRRGHARDEAGRP